VTTSTSTVTVHYFGADPATFEVVNLPWEWRTFTVIDTGNGTLSYLPTVNIARIEVQAVNGRPAIAGRRPA
jgi:hypothetical protein